MKKPKIVFVPSTVVDSLRPYIDEILQGIADVFNMPGATGALVSDESALWCFMDSVPTGKRTKHPFKDKMIQCVTSDTPENRALVVKLAERLEVPVGFDDRLYEIAIKLRDK